MPIDPRRVARLEDAVKALHQQVNVLIGEVRLLAVQAAGETHAPEAARTAESTAAPAPPTLPKPVAPPPPPPPPIANVRRESLKAPLAPQPARDPVTRPSTGGFLPLGPRGGMSLETLVGRYGMIGAAVLLLLMGVGTFISWAIANNVVTPGGRVGLGALGAAVFVAAGFVLRRRGDRQFGNVMLALALAIIHTVAWGAGPKLHIVDDRIALGLAALASVALAALALADEDQTLFVVGVGGALLAPFVTSSGRVSGPLTLVYGWIVITAGLFAMRGHRWRLATRMMTLAGVTYAGVGLVGATFSGTREQMWPPMFALACTWSAGLLASAEYRATLVRSYMTTMTFAIMVAAVSLVPGATHVGDIAPLALAGTVSLYLIQRPLTMQREQWLLDAIGLPLALLAAAMLANGGLVAPNGAAIALIWGVAAASAALMNEQERRGPHYLGFALATLISVAYLLRHETLLLGLGFVTHAVAMVLLIRKERVRLVGLSVVVALVLAMSQGGDLLAARPEFINNPFVNPGALVVLAVIIAAWLFFDTMAKVDADTGVENSGWAPVRRVFLPVALFAWGWKELGSTVARDVATSLVTLYFALVGVGAIHYGRVRSVAISRHTGLGLCVIAAGMAISRVWGLETIGIKAGTFVLVSLFMLAVAYWYRRAGEEQTV